MPPRSIFDLASPDGAAADLAAKVKKDTPAAKAEVAGAAAGAGAAEPSPEEKVLRKVANSVSHYLNSRGRRQRPLHVLMPGIWDIVDLPLWLIVISRNGDCGFANAGVDDNWEGCDRREDEGEYKCKFHHCCGACRSTEHTAFEENDSGRYVCDNVRVLAEAGHDVRDDMAVLRAASIYVTGSSDEWFAVDATRANVVPEMFRRPKFEK